MSDTGCTVTFDGDQGGTYFVDCSSVKYIDSIDLTNTSSSTIYLYRDKNSNHFMITLSPYTYPSYYYQSGYNSQTRYITNAANIRFNAMSNIYRNIDYVYLFVSFIVSVYCLFKLLRGFIR
ncbi:hypothetical protein RGT18_13860 [Solobacterium moorei]|nr:hypothetical protein RGT18_13860 [Solobacterium moorei]